ncbi:MAG: phosphate signaling complex protein PhoU [Pseudomonadota bacterium]
MKRPFQLNTHISAKYNQELEALKHSVLTMGGLLEQQMVNTLIAIEEKIPNLAERVSLNDAKIDAMEHQVEQECMRIIATRNPAASDLRLVMTVVKVATDLERIGDEIVRINRLIQSNGMPNSEFLLAGLLDIGNRIVNLMRGTLDAFARQDEKAAVIAHKQDADIDRVYKKLLEQTAEEIKSHPEDIYMWMDVLWSVRSFERIGDRCKSICEYVFFLNSGKNRKKISTKKNLKRLLKNG